VPHAGDTNTQPGGGDGRDDEDEDEDEDDDDGTAATLDDEFDCMTSLTIYHAMRMYVTADAG